METNVLKLAFLLSYLAMLICLASGIPFMTALFRAIVLMVFFSAVGLMLRWYLLKLIGSVHMPIQPSEEPLETWEEQEEEEPVDTPFAPGKETVEDASLPPG